MPFLQFYSMPEPEVITKAVAAMDGFLRTDLQGRILEVNETYCRMSGYSERELLTMAVADIEAVITAEKIAAAVERAAAQGPQRFESLHRRKNGSLFDVEVSAQYLPIPGHAVAFIRDTTRAKKGREALREQDITEPTRAEEALRRSEAYLAEGQRLSHTGSWAFDVASNKYIYASEECRRIFEIDGQQDFPREAVSRKIHPEDWGRVNEDFEKLLREKVDTSSEFRLVLPRGTVKHVQAIRHPVLSDAGDVVRVIGTAIDITERKRAEEALRQSETRLRTLVDHAAEAFFMLDFEQVTVIDVNRPACESLGYTREELIGKTPLAFDVNLDRATLDSTAERTEAGETVLFDRHWHRRKDGSLFPVEVHTSLFWHGGRRFLLKVARDISERVRAEEALRSSEAERRRAETTLHDTRVELERVSRVTTMGALTASIAHEVNQPLAGVVTSANAGLNWLAVHPPNLSKAREALERVRRDGTRASEVIARIRGLLNRTPSHKAPLSVNQIVRDVLALTAGELRAHNIKTASALDPNLLTVVGDTIRLQQVLLNLITNAIEAMAEGTNRHRTLCIQSTRGELDGKPAVVVAVSDTGIGLGNIDVARLFEAFRTTKPQGMGMGLWICRSIVEDHGGRLTAQANTGPGATFVLTIPVEHGVAK